MEAATRARNGTSELWVGKVAAIYFDFRFFFGFVFWQYYRVARKGTELETIQCHTIRLKLFKIASRVRVTVRRVWFHLSSSYPCFGA